jgi:hypothetical protein
MTDDVFNQSGNIFFLVFFLLLIAVIAQHTARPAKGPTARAFPPATPQRPSKAVLRPHAAREGGFATPGARNASGHTKTERKKKAASSAEASAKLFEAVNAHEGFLPANMGWLYHLGVSRSPRRCLVIPDTVAAQHLFYVIGLHQKSTPGIQFLIAMHCEC